MSERSVQEKLADPDSYTVSTLRLSFQHFSHKIVNSLKNKKSGTLLCYSSS